MAKEIYPIFEATIVGGEIKLFDREGFKKYIRTLKDGLVEVIVRRLRRHRSNEQNKYYWSVVIGMIAEEMGELIGEEVHEYLKSLFLRRGVDVKGKRFEVIRSTTDLSTIEFEEYLEKIMIWANLELNLKIPKPNEVDF